MIRKSIIKSSLTSSFFFLACEKLLRKFLIRDPFKRGSLEMLIDDPWVNEGCPDSPIVSDLSFKVEEDENIVMLMVAKYHLEKEAILKSLRENMFDDIAAIYYLLYHEKAMRAQVQAEVNALQKPMSTAITLSTDLQLPPPAFSPRPIAADTAQSPTPPFITSKSASTAANNNNGLSPVDEDAVITISPLPQSTGNDLLLKNRQAVPTTTVPAAAVKSDAARRRRFTVGGEADMQKFIDEDEKIHEVATALKQIQQPKVPVNGDISKPIGDGGSILTGGPRHSSSTAPTPRPTSLIVPPSAVLANSSTTTPSEGESVERGGPRKRHNTISGIFRIRRQSDAASLLPPPNLLEVTTSPTTATPSYPTTTSSLTEADGANKPRSLRFTFNSNTTSSKDPDEIVRLVLTVCTKHDIKHKLSGRFLIECTANYPPGSKEVVKFEIEVCKLPRLNNLHGLRFKRVAGSSTDYKEVCELILGAVDL